MIPIIEVFQDLNNPDPNYTNLYRLLGCQGEGRPWSSIAKQFPNTKHILDLGCGAGRVAIPLIKMGYQVVGVDINSEMLKLSHEFCPELKTIQSRIEDVNLNRKFDGTMLASFLIGYCEDIERDKIINAAVQHTKSGGWIGIELFNLSWLQKAENLESSAQKIVCENFDPLSQTWSGYTEYYFVDIHYIQKFSIKGFTDSQLKQYLHKWGLNLEKKFPSPNSISYVYVATLG